MRFIFIALLFSFALLSASHSIIDDNELSDDTKCGHHKRQSKPGIIEIAEVNYTTEGRELQTTTYPNIRFATDYTYLNTANNITQEFRDYVMKDLMPPIIDYFQATLRIKYPIATTLKTTLTSVCGFTTPSILRTTGVAADYYIIFTGEYDTSSWAASSTACFTSSSSRRPLIGKIEFNTRQVTLPYGNPLVQERNTYLIMHEFTHFLGFSDSLYDNYVDDNGNLKTGHIKKSSTGSLVLDVYPLTDKLRKHFGCLTIEGATMENDGSASGSIGSHFERRQFLYEYMTSGVLHGRRISELSLSVLEGTGWYVVNYTMAEPYFFGQGQGCNFLTQACSTTVAIFDEFCVGSNRGCSPTGRGGGKCSSDSKSDGCRYYYPDIDYDCENADGVSSARLPTREVYGRGLGSRCFTGNLTTSTYSSVSSTSLCFKFTCSGIGASTTLSVQVGSTTVTCAQEGKIKVTGLNGMLDCPDPITYCNTVGRPYCPRGCMGRGTCVNDKCVCKTGFTGIDCGLNVASTA